VFLRRISWKPFAQNAVRFGLDQDDPHVRAGMRITFELMKEMNEICQQSHVQFLIVVIPTKEQVFSDCLEHNSKIPLSDVTHKLLVNERSALAQTFKFMDDSNIPYVDPLPALKTAAGLGLYAASAGDMHPGKNGFRVIGEATAETLKQSDRKN